MSLDEPYSLLSFPSALYQDWFVWPVEYGRGNGVSLLRLDKRCCSSLFAHSFSLPEHSFGGSQSLCHEHPMERLHGKELRSSANSYVSKPGSRCSSQIKLPRTTLWLRSWRQSHEIYPEPELPSQTAPRFLPNCAYIFCVYIFHISEQNFDVKNKQNLGFPCIPLASSETGWGNKFLLC